MRRSALLTIAALSALAVPGGTAPGVGGMWFWRHTNGRDLPLREKIDAAMQSPSPDGSPNP